MKGAYTILYFLLFSDCLFAQATKDTVSQQHLNFHFQQTVITQYHPDFGARYTGQNSLLTHEPAQTSLTSTLYIGARLWKGAQIYLNPEIAGGAGLSKATGVAGFVNGETFRIGDPQPKVYLARLYLQHYFSLTNKKETVNNDANQLAGTMSKSYLSITAGKFCLVDFFDNSSFSHDPRMQFLNWALMSNGAWDYPANTRGYTAGMMIEYKHDSWTVRAATTLEPTEANGPKLNFNYRKAHGETIEFEKHYALKTKEGCVRVLGFYNTANMGNYLDALKHVDIALPGIDQVDVTTTRKEGRTKYGCGINAEQNISDHAGVFFRASWNDGLNETWAYTEIDQSVSGGYSLSGNKWNRKEDHVGIAAVMNGISPAHRKYLQAGGYGFIIGDGKLSYANEIIFETYYSFSWTQFHFYLSPDYQFVLNPAYNKDRGPVNIFGLRVHVEF